jgi:hypothetical protein
MIFTFLLVMKNPMIALDRPIGCLSELYANDIQNGNLITTLTTIIIKRRNSEQTTELLMREKVGNPAIARTAYVKATG